MKCAFRLMALAAAAAMAAPALAQDSVSKAQGPDGDAVSPWNTGEQINNYVVDLTEFITSKGTRFGIAPIIKQSKTGSANFTSLPSGNSASSWTQAGAPWAAVQYMLWSAPGFGVNNDTNLNDPGQMVAPEGDAFQVGVAFSEFATSDSAANINNVIAGIVQYTADDPSRLYVQRVMAAANSADGTTNQGQFGVGTADSSGNVAFRADNFGTSGGNPLLGQNIFRVEAGARNGSIVNVIGRPGGITGGTDATTVVLDNSATTHNVPGMIDETRAQAAGGALRPSVIATNFDTFYRFETAPGTLTPGDAAHRPGTSDHRGNLHYSHRQLFAGTAGTAAMITRPDPFNTNKGFSVWGVDPVGAVISPRTETLPATIDDNHPSETFTLGVDGFITDIGFFHYTGPTGFRGSNGPIAIGMDAQGRALIAGYVGDNGLSGNDPEGAIAVARFDPANPASSVEWTLAAWNVFLGGQGLDIGKAIFDDLGAEIGNLSTLFAVTNGTVTGPSLSAPAFDAAGNIWFLGTMQTYRGNGPDQQTFEGDDGYNTALFRAVYDPATFSYEIENVLKAGFVFRGQNSDRDYQIRFLNLNTTTANSPAGIWSGSIVQTGLAGASPGDFDPKDPRNLGGIVVMAEIVYDVDEDGEFNKVTGAGGDPNSLDQEYNVMLYIGSIEADDPGVPCPADFNGSGNVDGTDLGILLLAWGPCPAPCPPDLNASGNVDGTDLGILLLAWGPCP